MKRHIRLLLISLLMVLLLGVIGFAIFIFYPSLYTNQIEATLSRELSARYGMSVSLGNVHGNLIKGFEASNLTLFGLRESGRIEAEKLVVSYSLGDVIKGELKLKQLHLVKPHIILDLTEDVNKPVTASENQTQSREIRVDTLVVSDGIVEVIDKGYTYRLEGVNFNGKFSMSDDELALGVDLGEFAYPAREVEVGELSGNVKYKDKTLSLENLVFSALDGRVLLNGTMELSGSAALNMEVEASVSSFDGLLAALGQDVKLSGNMSASGSVEGSLGELGFNVKASGEAQGRTVKDISVRGIYRGTELEFTKVSGEISGAFIDGNAKITREGMFSGNLNVSGADLAEAGFTDVQSDINGRITFSGSGYTVDSLEVTAEVELMKSVVRGVEIGSATTSARISENTLFVDTLRAEIGGATVAASGWLGRDKTFYADIDLNADDASGLGDILNLGDVTGSVRAGLSLEGSLDDPNLKGRMYLSDFAEKHVEIGTLTGIVVIEGIRKKRNGTVILNADNSLVRGFRAASASLSAEIDGETVRVKRLSAVDGKNNLKLTGWSRGLEEFGIDTLTLDYSEYHFENLEAVNIVRTGDLVSLEPTVLKLNEGEVNLSAYWEKGTDSLHVTALVQGLEIKAFSDAVEYKTGFSGLLNGSVSLSNTLKNPVMGINLAISDAVYGDNIFERVKVAANYENRLLSIEELRFEKTPESWIRLVGTTQLRLPSGGNTASVLNMNDSLNYSVTLQNVTLSDYDEYNPLSFNYGGLTSGTLHASGTYIRPVIDFALEIAEGWFERVQLKKASGKGVYADSVLSFSEIKGSSENGEYEGYGYLPVNLALWRIKGRSLDNPVDLYFSGKSADLHFLTAYLGNVEDITGEFEYNLRIHGTYKNQLRDGEFTAKDGRIDTIILKNSPSNISARMRMKDNRATIEQCSGEMKGEGRSGMLDVALGKTSGLLSGIKGLFGGGSKKEGSGKFTVGGSMDFSTFFQPRMNVDLKGESLYMLSLLGEVESVADAELKVTGRDTLVVTGEVFPEYVIIRVEFMEDLEENVIVEEKPYLVYNIHVVMPRNFFLKNSQADMEFLGDIWIIKVPEKEFNYSGSVSSIKGKFFYLNDTFRVERADVSFTPLEFNPSFDVLATTDIRIGTEDVKIFVQMGGTLEKPTYSFYDSNDEYSESEILSLINFRQTAADVTGGEITTGVGMVATSYLEKTLEDWSSRVSGFDTIDIQSKSGTPFQSLQNTEIILGRQLSSNFFLTYQGNLSNLQSASQFGLEYKFNRNMSFDVIRDYEGLLNVNYTLRYVY